MLAQVDAASWTSDYPLVAICAGFALLLGGANVLVRGAVWIALVLGVSPMTVGLTLVAFGTSLPELLVSLTSAWKGSSDIAMANVVGSNAMNVLLIVGTAAVIRPIHVVVDRLELVYMLLATALLVPPFALGVVDRPIAAVMFALVVAFCWQLLRRERRAQRLRRETSAPDLAVDPSRVRGTPTGWLVHVLLLFVGFALLKYGADWLIDGSVTAARGLGISDALIGMTIVAGGTSLPELATSAIAARKGHSEIAIGNVLGSNIFNVGCVLGVCGLVHPLEASAALLPLLALAVGSAIWLALVLRVRFGTGRVTGALFLLAWAGFVVWQAWREGAF
ncbi:MAG: sodium:calcium antiporter [Planctomycetota bacterium]